MADTAPRVVVLGSAGEAQQQLLNALKELGAQTLAVGDFDQLDPVRIREQQPDVWLVSIDEGTDSGRLERWQPLFDDPDATVIFDDADVTRRLSGWDLARWARHLAAKVLGRDDVLPPVSPDAERLPQAAAIDGDNGSHEQENDSLDQGSTAPSAQAGSEQAESSEEAETSEAAATAETATTETATTETATTEAETAETAEFSETTELSLTDDADFAALNASFESERQQRESSNERPAMALDDMLFAQSEAAAKGGEAASSAAPAQAAEGSTTAAAEAKSGLSGLSLVGLDVDFSTPRVAKAAEPEVPFDVSHLELAPLDEGNAAPVAEAASPNGGLIALIAGLGGPDAVRQFLGGLPETLPVPVLLWQHLDAGKHDRLAQQLAKATKLPVYLAKATELAKFGAVGVMSAGLGVMGDGGWWFKQGSPSPAHALAPALSDATTVLAVLSGAEPAVVEFARAHHAKGGLVLVQTSATCFDGTAASALESLGIASGAPADLAAKAAERWPSGAA